MVHSFQSNQDIERQPLKMGQDLICNYSIADQALTPLPF
jgi:hypothetical protein